MKQLADYSQITESPGLKATKEQVARIGQRYCFALNYDANTRILEVGCGSGMGLGYLTKGGKCRVVGGDLDDFNIKVAQKLANRNRSIELVRFDSQTMPFIDASFDRVVCFEAIYYFPEPEHFVSEAFRVLKKNGLLVLSSVNCAWPDFHPSPYATKYYNSLEMSQLLSSYFSSLELFVGFPVQDGGVYSKIFSLLKRIAVAGNLIPGSLRARVLLKRLFIGKLVGLPLEVTDSIVPNIYPVPLSTVNIEKKHKILYAVAKKL